MRQFLLLLLALIAAGCGSSDTYQRHYVISQSHLDEEREPLPLEVEEGEPPSDAPLP
jgi:hypothetical protein